VAAAHSPTMPPPIVKKRFRTLKKISVRAFRIRPQAEVTTSICDVYFAPESGYSMRQPEWPLRVIYCLARHWLAGQLYPRKLPRQPRVGAAALGHNRTFTLS
jgi:hypothetical protein